jgi:hypothetical protein
VAQSVVWVYKSRQLVEATKLGRRDDGRVISVRKRDKG